MVDKANVPPNGTQGIGDPVSVGATAVTAAVDPLDLFAGFLRLDVAAGDASGNSSRSYQPDARQSQAWCRAGA